MFVCVCTRAMRRGLIMYRTVAYLTHTTRRTHTRMHSPVAPYSTPFWLTGTWINENLHRQAGQPSYISKVLRIEGVKL